MSPHLKEVTNAALDQVAYNRISIVLGRVAIWTASVALIPIAAWFYNIDVQSIHHEEKLQNLIKAVDSITTSITVGRDVRQQMLATDAKIIAIQDQQWETTKRVMDSLQLQLNRLDDKIDRVDEKYGGGRH